MSNKSSYGNWKLKIDSEWFSSHRSQDAQSKTVMLYYTFDADILPYA